MKTSSSTKTHKNATVYPLTSSTIHNAPYAQTSSSAAISATQLSVCNAIQTILYTTTKLKIVIVRTITIWMIRTRNAPCAQKTLLDVRSAVRMGHSVVSAMIRDSLCWIILQ